MGLNTPRSIKHPNSTPFELIGGKGIGIYYQSSKAVPFIDFYNLLGGVVTH